MKHLIKKFLGIDKIEEKISILEELKLDKCSYELQAKRISQIQYKVHFLYENITIDPYEVLEKHKYCEFNNLPNFIQGIFEDLFQNVQYKFVGNDEAIFCNERFVGYTVEHLGEIIDRIAKIESNAVKGGDNDRKQN